MSMHELELVKIIADTVVCIGSNGKIDRIGSVSEIFTAEYIEKLFSIRSGSLSKVYGFIYASNEEYHEY